jgi:hypothetical protein
MNLEKIISRFAENLEVLRGFVDLVNPILSEKLEDEVKKNEPFLSSFLYALSKELGEDTLPIELNDEIKNKSSKEYKFVFNKNDEDELQISFNPKDAKSFESASQNISKYSNQANLLFTNSLISLVSFSEWFLSQIFHFYFDKFPESINIKERNLTFEQLETFDSIEDARNFLIDLKIEEILRGNIESWFNVLKKELNLSLNYIDPHLENIREIYQRRNLLVHNGGTVNSVYLSKVNQKLRKDVEKGQTLQVSQEYLDKAISILEQIFILIGSELWKKIDKNDDERGSLLISIIFDRLCDGNYIVSEGLSMFLVNDKGLPEKDRLIAKINYWQSLKWQGKLKEIQEEILNTDFSAKEEIFLLAKYALLDKYSDFYKLLPRLVESEKISRDDLQEWPLFKKIREKKSYSNRIKKLFPESQDKSGT